MIVCALHAQEVTLPLDLRQHNLTNSNSSILNPAFSVNYGNSHSIGLWSRWQWQMIDGDPTTLFFNYTGKLNQSSSIGAGFYQHNTGVYLNTGGLLNYAYKFAFNERTSLTFGLNLFGFQQEFSGIPFQGDPQIQLPQLDTNDGFILQLAPGIQFSYDRFSLGFASENMVDYNMTEKKRNAQSGERIILGTATYDFPVAILKSEGTSVLRPMIYVKSIPGYDTQIGMSGFLSTNKFWAQTGYNSFYGISIGGGGRFMEHLSIGALVEFGTKSDLKGNDPTFEFVTAYDFGNVIPQKKILDFEEEEEEKELEEIAEVAKIEEEISKAEALAAKRSAREQQKEQRKKTRDSLELVKKELAIAANSRKKQERRTDSINRTKQREAIALERISKQRRLDSLAMVNKEKALAEANKRKDQIKLDSIKTTKETEALSEAQRIVQHRKTDSINDVKIAAEAVAKEKVRLEQIAQQSKEDKPRAGEKYEEVVGEDGLIPGYYLIANVFATKKYLDDFMANLTKKGLQPKSFFRSKDKYNYVYLERYDTMDEARKARDSKLNGRYVDKMSIYSVEAKDSLALVKKEAAVPTNLRKEQERKTDSISKAKQREAVVLERILKQKRLDSLARVDKEKALAEANKQKELIKLDSINTAKEAEALAEAQRIVQQRKTDSINDAKIAVEAVAKEKVRLEQIAQQSEEDKPRAGEKYEEVVGEDGLTPGYYLIANVFGTKRYFDAFMANLIKKGLQPKSFFRTKNKYNYVYLEKYDTMNEARNARDGKFNGRYDDKTWIYRVKPK